MFNGKIRYTQQYAVTVTLHPKVRRYTAEEQYEAYAHEVVLKDLRVMFPLSKITLVAELTKSFDLHFHGIIQFVMGRSNQNWCKYFRDKFRNHKVIGFVLLKPVDDDKKWIEYIGKSLADFSQDLNGKQAIIVDDHDIFISDLIFRDENAQANL